METRDKKYQAGNSMPKQPTVKTPVAKTIPKEDTSDGGVSREEMETFLQKKENTEKKGGVINEQGRKRKKGKR